MRLIDVDKLSFHCNYEGDCSADISHCQEQCSNYVLDYRDIKDQPTAYDIDRIVGQLKMDSSVKLYGSGNSNNYLIPLERAIEIVKAGGTCQQAMEEKHIQTVH